MVASSIAAKTAAGVGSILLTFGLWFGTQYLLAASSRPTPLEPVDPTLIRWGIGSAIAILIGVVANVVAFRLTPTPRPGHLAAQVAGGSALLSILTCALVITLSHFVILDFWASYGVTAAVAFTIGYLLAHWRLRSARRSAST